MASRTVAIVVALFIAPLARAEDPAAPMYTAARAQEHAVRLAMEGDRDPAATLKEAHAVVAAYRAIVRQYPASSYSDDALWFAGRLSLDAFAMAGHVQDRDLGIRLLHLLAAQYPTSRLARRVPAHLNAAAPGQESALDSMGTERAGVGVRAPIEKDSRPRALTAQPALATIKDVRRAVLPDVVRVTVELDDEVPFHDERIENPTRVFVDLASTRAAPLVGRTLRFDGDADAVRQIRIGRHPHHVTRIVLDATGVASYSAYPLYNPFRLVIDCVRSSIGTLPDGPPAARPVPVLASRRLSLDWTTRSLAVAPQAAAVLAEAPAATATPPLTAAVVTPPSTNSNGGFSIARQLGLGVSRLVIDPGHGGHDPGAKGKGLTEAELVLDVALRLEALLKRAPGLEVVLTRRTDEFVALQERTAIANREGADLFLSIHANASQNGLARGIETYFLNFATNLGAAAVAARENAASGQAMAALPDFVKAIALNNKLDESRDLATIVQRAMVERLRREHAPVRNLGVKQAPFVVLIGAAMPSVLAEISFVTNAQDAKLLKTSAYRERIAAALAAGIRKYQRSLATATRVAHQ